MLVQMEPLFLKVSVFPKSQVPCFWIAKNSELSSFYQISDEWLSPLETLPQWESEESKGYVVFVLPKGCTHVKYVHISRDIIRQWGSQE
jgi:hypothetical protein